MVLSKKGAGRENMMAKEIAGVVSLAFAVLVFLCLFSYNPHDPSLTHYVAGKVMVANYGGLAGSYLSDSMLRVFGMTSYLFPVLLVLFSFKLFLGGEFRMVLSPVFGFMGLVFASSALLAARSSAFSFYGVDLNAGGLLGKFSLGILYSGLNQIGAEIVLVVILLISVMITLNVSLVAFVRRLAILLSSVLLKFRTFVVVGMGRLRRKKSVTKQKKPDILRNIPVISDEVGREEEEKEGAQTSFGFLQPEGSFSPPSLDLLDRVEVRNTRMKRESLIMNSRILEKKLADFGVEGSVTEVKPGPVITMYELEPAAGVKINKITNLSDDLALALKAQSVRIVAPIPGTAAIGIEIPNYEREPVYLRDVLDGEEFLESKYKLPIVLGKNITGKTVITDLVKMPHLLIAGTTGSGKSVSLNAMICSILFKATPDEVKFIMIDPKRLELSGYEGIPHLLNPVVVNPKEASQALKWTVDEMERRYAVIAEVGAKSIERYNRLVEKEQNAIRKQMSGLSSPVSGGEPAIGPEKLPYIVVVIDELADLMMVAQRNVETSLARLAQMARAAGIHLILATQRPSVDVITGIIKANFPTRISFQVSSKVDSRTILDQLGAEKLLGAGDMLFMPPGTSKLARIHGAFVSDREITKIVSFIKRQGAPLYDESISHYNPESREGSRSEEEFDEKYDEAVELVTDLGQASISLVQRYLKIGYNRAARIVEKMEAEGVVGPSDGAKPRKVLAGKLPQ
ncbi:MAG: DNA translocase FtsK 4TM domain-containing protein [Deltaproteobacteria bacterium]|nr:DNA translocase FtsK 4TM domain-containing protein [Deltaproteobacteria bacterium]